jgi:hypothetical protein
VAIEIAGRHRELMRNIDTVKAFLNGKRGGEAYAMVLGLFEELERLSDDWRWVEEAYRVADRVDSTAWVKSTPEVEALIEKLRPKPKP